MNKQFTGIKYLYLLQMAVLQPSHRLKILKYNSIYHPVFNCSVLLHTFPIRMSMIYNRIIFTTYLPTDRSGYAIRIFK